MIYKPVNELRLITGALAGRLPPLKEQHLEVLEELDLKKNNAFYTNRNKFFIREIFRYADEKKVLRTTHMGETRGGKSEGAQMTALVQVHFFNLFYTRGHFDSVDVDIQKGLVELRAEHIHRNKTDYLNAVRDSFKKKDLLYGTTSVIDEEEESIGGLGSASEMIELRNYNNIVAKYNLGEHWIYPKRFMDMNASYGIHWFIKDHVGRLNWGLLYRMENWSKGISSQSFLGWVAFPLHENHQLRKDYEHKKNAWINEVIHGGGDPRAKLRQDAAEIVAQDPLFAEMKTDKSFLLTNNQQLDIVDDLVRRGVLQTFNAQERERIADSARLIVKRNRMSVKASYEHK